MSNDTEIPPDDVLAAEYAAGIIAAGPEPNVTAGLLEMAVHLATELVESQTQHRGMLESNAALRAAGKNRRVILARFAEVEPRQVRVLALLKDIERRVKAK